MRVIRNNYGLYGINLFDSDHVITNIEQKIEEIDVGKFTENGSKDVTNEFLTHKSDKEMDKTIQELKIHNDILTFMNSKDFVLCVALDKKTVIQNADIQKEEYYPEKNVGTFYNLKEVALKYVPTEFFEGCKRYEDCFSIRPKEGDIIVIFENNHKHYYTSSSEKYEQLHPKYALMIDENYAICTAPVFYAGSNYDKTVWLTKLSDYLKFEAQSKYKQSFLLEYSKGIDPLETRKERLEKYIDFNSIKSENLQEAKSYSVKTDKSFIEILSLIQTGELNLAQKIKEHNEELTKKIEARNQIARLNKAINDANKINPTKITYKYLAEILNRSRQTVYNMFSEVNNVKKVSEDSLKKISDALCVVTPHWLDFGYDFPEILPLKEQEKESYIREFNSSIERLIRKISNINDSEERIKRFKSLASYQNLLNSLLKRNNIELKKLNLTDSFYSNYLPAQYIKVRETKNILDKFLNIFQDKTESESKSKNNTFISNSNQNQLKKYYDIEFFTLENGFKLVFEDKTDLGTLKLIYNSCKYLSEKIEIKDYLLIKTNYTVADFNEQYKKIMSKTLFGGHRLGIFILRVNNCILLAEANVNSVLDQVTFSFINERNREEELIFFPPDLQRIPPKSSFLYVTGDKNAVFSDGEKIEIEIVGKVIQVIKNLE